MNQDVQAIVHHPFVIELGRFDFTGFGLAVLLAFVIAQTIAQRELFRRGHDPSPISDLIIAAVVGGIVGAKVYYAFVVGEPRDLFTRAGFVFWGGLIGGIIAVLAVAKAKKLHLPRIMDVGAICVAAAYAVGRTGCWAVGDDYGKPWFGSRWAVMFPEGAPPSTAQNLLAFGYPIPPDVALTTVLPVHPTQLYEVTLGFLMFLFLWRIRDHRHAEGWLFGVYCVLAGVERFVIEFFRAKDDRFFGAFTIAQVIAVGFVVAGVVMMWWWREVRPGRSGIHAAGVAR
jgi:phosphatidylglycerol:prolipoprotein diacylglycerol transferase